MSMKLSCKSVNPIQCSDLKDIVYATFYTRNYMNKECKLSALHDKWNDSWYIRQALGKLWVHQVKWSMNDGVWSKYV